MNMSGASIVQDSNTMFQIINQAQVSETNLMEKIAVMSISEMTNASGATAAVSHLGNSIDVFA